MKWIVLTVVVLMLLLTGCIVTLLRGGVLTPAMLWWSARWALALTLILALIVGIGELISEYRRECSSNHEDTAGFYS